MLLSLSCFVFTSAFCKAQSDFATLDLRPAISTDKFQYFFVDDDNEFSIHNLPVLEKWNKPSNKDGFVTKGSLWIHFNLSNDLEHPTARYFTFHKEQLDEIEIHLKRKDKTDKYVGGDSFKRLDRLDYIPINTFKIHFAAKESVQVFIRISSLTIIKRSLTLYNPDFFVAQKFNTFNVQNIYVGIIVALIFFALYLFMVFREKVFLFYIFFIFTNASAIMLYKGWGYILFGYLPGGFGQIVTAAKILCFGSFLIFFDSFLEFKKFFPKLSVYFKISAFFMIPCLIFLLTPYPQIGARVSELIFLPAALICIFSAVAAIIKGNRSAVYSLVSILSLFFFAIVAFSESYGYLSSNAVTKNAFFIGSSFEAIIFAFGIYRKIYVIKENLMNSVQSYNDTLEIEVAKQTEQIRAKSMRLETMMKVIPLGILIIDEKGIVRADSSPNLIHIFGKNIQATNDPWKLLFEHSNQSGDFIERNKNAVLTSFSEELVQFQLNKRHLIQEVEIKANNTTKILELTWLPLLDERNLISHFLIAINDRTQKLKDEQEMLKISYETNLIRNMVDIGIKPYRAIIDGLQEYLEKVKISFLSQDKHHALYALHSIKGNARFAKLSEVSELAHLMEQKIQKDSLFWGLEKLEAEIISVHKTFLRYFEFSKNHQRIMDIAEDFVFSRKKDSQALVEAYLEDSSSLISILEPMKKSISKMARILGKAEPQIIVVPEKDLIFRSNFAPKIQSALNHLLVNALDHSIELGTLRKKKGKSDRGKININFYQKADFIWLDFFDDGAGVNARTILEKGKTFGIAFKDTQEMEFENITKVLLSPEFSTKNHVSEYSGRGVGLTSIFKDFNTENNEFSFEPGEKNEFGQQIIFRFKISNKFAILI